MNKKERLKEIKRKYMQWCSECPWSTYGYECSGYQSEKCLKEREEWLKKQLKNIRD